MYKLLVLILLSFLFVACRGKDGKDGTDSSLTSLLFKGTITENITSIYIDTFKENDVVNVYVALPGDLETFFQINGPINVVTPDTNSYFEIIVTGSGSALVRLKNIPIGSLYKVYVLKPTPLI